MTQETDRKDYYGKGLQPWDLFKAMGIAIPFAVANVIKYVSRFGAKNGLDDLLKARWYLDRLIELVQAQQPSHKPENCPCTVKGDCPCECHKT